MPAAVRPEDVAFNRVSVALARSQSLVASWLPPRTAEENAAQKSDEQLQQEEKALFTPGADILGVGAEPPKEILDGSFKRSQLSSNDKLRQQILGKHARATHSANARTSSASHLPTKKPEKPARPARAQEDSDDDEEGRAAMFKSKKQKASAPVLSNKRAAGSGDMDSDDSEQEVKGKTAKKTEAAPSPAQEKPRKRPVSYLDQILEERAQKKKKKQKAPGGTQEKEAAKPEHKVESGKGKDMTSGSRPLQEREAESDGTEDGDAGTTSKQAPSAAPSTQESTKPASVTDNAQVDESEKKKKKQKKKKKANGEVPEIS